MLKETKTLNRYLEYNRTNLSNAQLLVPTHWRNNA